MSRLFYDEAMSNAAPPLDGLLALDFTHALAGPYCTMLMATYGANVVKVEEPEHGFPIRPDRCAAPHHCPEPIARQCCATRLARVRVPVSVPVR